MYSSVDIELHHDVLVIIFLFLSLLIPSFSLQGMSKMADLSDITDYGLKDEEQVAQHLSKEEYDKQSEQLKRLQTM